MIQIMKKTTNNYIYGNTKLALMPLLLILCVYKNVDYTYMVHEVWAKHSWGWNVTYKKYLDHHGNHFARDWENLYTCSHFIGGNGKVTFSTLQYMCHAIETKSWLNITCGFIPRKIQRHIHTGRWSLVN